MAKRRRKKPNIPKAAMEHARQQLEDDDSQPTPAKDIPEKETVKEVEKTPVDEAPRPSRRDRRSMSVEEAKLRKRKNAEGGLDSEYVAEMLANPTKVVTEEELHEEYGFVVKDLRNMGILAAVLFVCLVGVALVIL